MRNFLIWLFDLEKISDKDVAIEILKQQLALVQQERDKLLNKLLEVPEKHIEESPEINLESLKPKYVPWNVRRESLEKESAHRAKLMRDKAAEIADAKKTTATVESREKLIVGDD